MSERLQYQVAAYINRRVYKTDKAAERARVKAMRQFLNTGMVSVRGVKIVGRWRNPDRRDKSKRDWRTTEDPGQSLYDMWDTLHGKSGALRELAERYDL